MSSATPVPYKHVETSYYVCVDAAAIFYFDTHGNLGKQYSFPDFPVTQLVYKNQSQSFNQEISNMTNFLYQVRLAQKADGVNAWPILAALSNGPPGKYVVVEFSPAGDYYIKQKALAYQAALKQLPGPTAAQFQADLNKIAALPH